MLSALVVDVRFIGRRLNQILVSMDKFFWPGLARRGVWSSRDVLF